MSKNVSVGSVAAFPSRVIEGWAIARYGFAIAGLVLLVYAGVAVGSNGLSAFLVKKSSESSSISLANEAIRFNNRNPDAYILRAGLYQELAHTREALADLEHAVNLRPRDHFLWLQLGYLRYKNQDLAGAFEDFNKSAHLAPFYAQPRWYLGNLLLQTGRTEEGLVEIRRAVASDASYLSQAIELADDIYGGDARSISSALSPETSAGRLLLARYFIKHNSVGAALELLGEKGSRVSTSDRNIIISDLIAAKEFSAARDLWAAEKSGPRDTPSLLSNGGFESDLGTGSPGFEWRVSPNLQRLRVGRDESLPQSGSFSLSLSFGGPSPADAQIVTQIMPAEPSSTYRMEFAYRSKDLVTGGPPVVAVVDANDGQLLAQLKLPSNRDSAWAQYSIEFKTSSKTSAAIISVQRDRCSSSPCPAFGYAWFDSFVCLKL